MGKFRWTEEKYSNFIEKLLWPLEKHEHTKNLKCKTEKMDLRTI